jgi:hypothetical protein
MRREVNEVERHLRVTRVRDRETARTSSVTWSVSLGQHTRRTRVAELPPLLVHHRLIREVEAQLGVVPQPVDAWVSELRV